MDFNLTEEQQMFRDSVTKFAQTEIVKSKNQYENNIP